MISLIVDENIPFLKGVLDPYAHVVYLPGDRITNQDLKEADGLIVRTRTRCNRDLLDNTPVKFLATATIGTDHIDTAYCSSQHIQVSYAPGCNAMGVQQYIAAALAELVLKHSLTFNEITLGVVGVGNVGSRIVKLGNTLGMKVLQNDPPRERAEGPGIFTALDEIVHSADIISFHVPLTRQGEDATYGYIGEDFFNKLDHPVILLNTSRGEVINESSLKKALSEGKLKDMVIDVWHNEPHPDNELLASAGIATPHIAGYSTEGKANGTSAVVRAASKFFGFGIDDWYPENIPAYERNTIAIDPSKITLEEIIHEAISATYDIRIDSRNLKENPGKFELFRNTYPVRREFTAHRVIMRSMQDEAWDILSRLGFSLSN